MLVSQRTTDKRLYMSGHNPAITHDVKAIQEVIDNMKAHCIPSLVLTLHLLFWPSKNEAFCLPKRMVSNPKFV